MVARIPTLDLFSGIGGFSYALRDVCKTVAYCEIDRTCQSILMSCMQDGRLDPAPIIDDIRTFDSSQVRPRPVFATAGFPCTDVSSANPFGVGVKGLRSGLVNHVFRILDECESIKGVFLENSPFINTRGVELILDAFWQRGFEVRMMQLSARDVGALHKRTRWWCLAIKGSCFKLKSSKQLLPTAWSREPCRRLCKRTDSNYSECNNTNKAFGNAIVPICAQAAYNCLVLSESFNSRATSPSLKLVISNGETTFHRTSWPTPTAQKWHQYRTLSERSTRMLSNAIFYEELTIKQLEGVSFKEKPILDKKFVINPSFIAWLMGYPVTWHGKLCCK